MTTAASSSGTPRPIGAIRPVDGPTIATQRSLDEIPLVGAHDVLRHPHKMAGKSATGLIGQRKKHSVAADGALLGGVTLSAPGPLEAGTRHRILRRRCVSRSRATKAAAIARAAIAAIVAILSFAMSLFLILWSLTDSKPDRKFRPTPKPFGF
jgi:hypothetical protein